MDNVECDGYERTLLECDRNRLSMHNCGHHEDAGVKCNRDEEIIIKNISISSCNIRSSTTCAISTGTYTALITWKPLNMTPSSYKIECFNEQHQIKMLVNNETFSLEILGLFPSTSYNCCVSAVHARIIHS